MKKLIFLIVSAFIIQTSVLSQGCLPEGITFSNQSQIDNFQTNYPNCTEIEGGILIAGNYITNLYGLSVLQSLGSSLFINHTPNLINLTGLDNLNFIGGGLYIDDNEGLTSLTGLENLITIQTDIEIWRNDGLTNLAGLDNVTFVGGSLGINNNPNLNSLTGLDNVIYVVQLHIEANPSLSSLTGLANITSIYGDLIISENHSLTNLAGLDNIDAASIYDLSICYNNLLSTCEVQSVCNYLASPSGGIDIHDNSTGCNSQAEVEAACSFVIVEEINSEVNFSIYPNPATNEISIKNIDGIKLEEVNIYNQLGQKVLQRKVKNNKVDISSLEQGLYIIELVTDKIKSRQKLIIK